MIILGGLFINNFITAKFIGMCPFLGLSKKVDSAVGMGVAVTFIMTITSIVTFLIYKYILATLQVTYLDILVNILVIASLVQIIEIVLKKFSPSLYNAMGIYLPLITTNCAVLGIAQVVTTGSFGLTASPNILHAAVSGFFYGAGFLLAIVILAGIRSKVDRNKIAKPFQGFPITLLSAACMALAFGAFSGLKIF